MSLVTAARYMVVTPDSTTAQDVIEDALADALELLEEDLGRPLASAQRTERVYPDDMGRLYPVVTPITAIPSGYRQDGQMVYGANPFTGYPDLLNPFGWIDLVYTGGYVERSANPTAPNRLPAHVETDLCWAAYRALNPSPIASTVPVGATNVRLGDAAINFSPQGAPQGADATAVWSKATLRLKRPGKRI